MPVLRRLLSRAVRVVARHALRSAPVVALSLAVPALALTAQGTISVTAGTTTRLQLAPGTKFKVPITLDVTSAGTAAIASIAAELGWDPNGLTIDSVTAGTFGTLAKPLVRASSGLVTLAVFSATPASGSVVIANVWFTASATVAGTQLHLDVAPAANPQGAELALPTSGSGMDVCVAPLGKWGDVNADGAVNILDAQQIARAVVGLSLADTNTFVSTGDVTGDSTVNVIDAQQVARFAIGLSAPARTATDAFVVPPIAALTATPSTGLSVGVSSNSSSHVRVSAVSANGTGLAGCLPVSWKSSDTTKVRVTNAGEVTGVAIGTATLTAKVGTRSVSVPVNVGNGTSGSVATVEVLAGNGQVAGMNAVASITPMVRLKDSFGAVQPGATVRFTASSGSYIGASNILWVDVKADSLGIATLPNWTMPASGSTAQLSVQGGSSATQTITASLFATPASEHSCALLNTGAAYCWGNGARGQLGNGGNSSSSVAVPVSGGLSFANVSANTRGDHSCGVTSAGQAYCWGANSGGQLGDSTRTDRSTPVLVKGGLTWARLSTGVTSTCGLTTTGKLYCWGWGQYGQLGDSTAGVVATGPSAVKMPAGTTVTSFSTGANSACAVTSGGDVYCWGFGGPSNGNGTSDQKNVPTQVVNLTGAIAVSMGTTHACALVTSGAAYCWGGAGPLGDGTPGVSRATPIAVLGGHVFTELSAGNRNTCGLKSDSSVWCWGFNGSAQLGDSTTLFRPVPIAIPVTASKLFAGGNNGSTGDHRCALTQDARSVYCWGQASSGQLGDGTSLFRRIPTSVLFPSASSGTAVSVTANLPSFRQVATAGAAVTNPPSVTVRDGRGLGVQGVTVTFSVVSGGGSIAGTTATTDANGLATATSWTLGSTVGANVAQAAVTLASGSVGNAYFYATSGPAITSLAKISGDSLVITNQATTLADLPTVRVTGAGGVGVPGTNVTWVLGSTTVIQTTDSLGYSTLPGSYITTAGPSTFTTLTAQSGSAPSVGFAILGIPTPVGSPGNRNSHCGLAKAGIVYCWGQNNVGQLGNGTTTQRAYADSVSGGLRFTKLSLQNGGHHCALTSTGAAYCWGDNVLGQIGDGTSTTRLLPTAVTGGLSFIQIVTENETTCGLTSAGAVQCWGYLHSDGMGNVALRDKRVLAPTPVAMGGLSFTQIALWDQGICGITSAGAAYCMGENSTGTVGNGTFVNAYDGFVQVKGGLAFSRIAGGTGAICGVTTSGDAYCWGSGNSAGGLGDGTTTARFVPTPLATSGGRFTDIAVANFTGCGLRIDGTATCWGVNNAGQVGIGDISGSGVPFPTEIPGLKFTDLSIGSFRGRCGQVQSGSMYCWGSHSNGQLGDSSVVGTVTSRSTPVAVLGWPDGPSVGVPTTIAASSFWSKLVQVAPGTTIASPPSVIVKDRNNQPVVGVTVTFAIESGPGTMVGSIVKTDASGTATVTRFTTGGTVSDGITTLSATVAGLAPVYMMINPIQTATTSSIAFGDQQRGMIGSGSSFPGTLGVLVKDQYGNPMSGVTVSFAVTAGGGSVSPSSALTDANGIGKATYTSAGTANTPITVTAAVSGLPTLTFNLLVPTTANGQFQCDLKSTGAAYCWGDNVRGQIGDASTTTRTSPTAVSGGLIFSSLATGFGDHMCGLTAAGAAYCWGSNTFGELGDSTTTDRNVPVAVKGGLTFTSLAVSMSQSCGLTAAGAMYCWGSKDYSLLGDGVFFGYAIAPQQVNTGGVTFKQIGMGRSLACGLTNGGTVYCWGGGSWNGDGTSGGSYTAAAFTARATPVAIQDGRTYTTLAVGELFACAIANSGSTYCWGFNGLGQLGDGTTLNRTSPVPVNTTRVFTKLSLGSNHSCGLEADGTLSCWGRNADGRSGDGTTVFKTVPTLVTGGLTFTSIRATNGNTCAKATSGVPFCWGNNTSGFLGIGSTSPSQSTVPLQTNWVEGTAGTAISVRANVSPSTSYTRGTVLTNALSVKVRDFAGNAVSGVTVTFAVTGGGGTITTASVVTDANGIATLPNWTLGATAGTNTLTATVTGIGFVVFTTTGT